MWASKGYEICITSRRKDVAQELLDAYGFSYVDLGAVGRGTSSLAVEFIRRSLHLLKLARRFKPDVMVGIAGTSIAPVGKLLGVPVIVFTDTEVATVSNRIAFPFASAICTPTCYEVSVPPKKHITYPGYQELAYTHPNRFDPDPDLLRAFGVRPTDDYIVMRLVAWRAAHDLRGKGFHQIVDAVRQLERFGRILISAEGNLPATLEVNRLAGPLEFIHHLLYYARLFIGESATMASESAMLGTPAIFVSTLTRGYTNEQEHKYDLVYTFSDPIRGQEQALAKAKAILSDPDSKAKWRVKRDHMLADKIDVTAWMVNFVERCVSRTRNAG